MHRLLIIKTFKKVKDEEEKSTGIRPSDTAASKLLSDYIWEREKLSFGERRLSDYYRMAKKSEVDQVIVKDPRVVLAMCNYLDSNSFSDFKKANGIVTTDKKPAKNAKTTFVDFLKNHKVSIYISSSIVLIMLIIFSANKQRWMVWENDRYVEISFDPEKYNLGQIKLYNKERIKYFRRVIVDCETDFFDSNGKVKIWYGKNKNKELEFFTSLGLHPETGKTLDPITDYMIKKYVCN